MSPVEPRDTPTPCPDPQAGREAVLDPSSRRDGASTAEQVAVRHPKRGKAHRSTLIGQSSVTGRLLSKLSCASNRFVPADWEPVPLRQVATKDLCRICWGGRLASKRRTA